MNDTHRLRFPHVTDPSVNAACLQAVEEGISISVVSNSRLLREGLVTLLAPYLRAQLKGSYCANDSPDKRLPIPPYHVALIDSSIGQEVAMAWTRWWRGGTPAIPVLMLEVENSKDIILAYIETGIGGYTLKEAPPAEVAQAICLTSQGLAQCSPEMTAYLFARLAALRTAPALPEQSLVPLTSREMEVVRCIAQGMSNKEIATALVIETYTVKHHVHNILGKMNLRHRYEAARYAAEQGWVMEVEDFPPSTAPL